jgi:hypothetical protein
MVLKPHAFASAGFPPDQQCNADADFRRQGIRRSKRHDERWANWAIRWVRNKVAVQPVADVDKSAGESL